MAIKFGNWPLNLVSTKSATRFVQSLPIASDKIQISCKLMWILASKLDQIYRVIWAIIKVFMIDQCGFTNKLYVLGMLLLYRKDFVFSE